MAAVLVHPSRGHRDGRENLRRSLETLVDFRSAPLGETLTPDQRAALLVRHPTGLARFWGTYPHNATKINRVHEGDFVIFTGEGRAWAVGVVGLRFDNEAFARRLWRDHPDKGSYEHVYSLRKFEEVHIPYPAINRPLDNSLTYPFQAMAVYEGAKADALVDALQLTGESIEPAYADADAELAETLGEEVSNTSRSKSNAATLSVPAAASTVCSISAMTTMLRPDRLRSQSFPPSVDKFDVPRLHREPVLSGQVVEVELLWVERLDRCRIRKRLIADDQDRRWLQAGQLINQLGRCLEIVLVVAK